ncbi:hydroxyacid dehydrogenase, partial [Candidatus Parcubacteria bacterium]|nr:hydroxyacid dehydrogenase [Candidatus Parcubacteria bacterium]
MKKIVVIRNFDFTPKQVERLKKLGDVKFYNNSPATKEEWLNRAKDADVICSGNFGLKDNLNKLKNVFITYPFVALDGINIEQLKRNNITLANSPGCNKDAVSEWVISMTLNLFRKFPQFIKNNNLPKGEMPEITQSIKNKNVTILGNGNIGSRVGELCKTFEMNVTYFKRDDNLLEKTKNADVIINCLSPERDTNNLLDKNFFFSLKRSSYFITFTKKEIYDADAMIEALDKNILSGVADDCASEIVGDIYNNYYQKLLKHKKILVTPHIAWSADSSIFNGNEMVIDNIEAWIKGCPQNLI